MNDIRLSYSLWVEKYRPITIKELILPKSIKTTFTKLVSDGELPNLLFHSSTPGTGKTSTAQCLINDIGMDSIYINGSLEGIDSVRDKIIGFASSMSFSNKPKAIIIDEADGFSVQGQKSLRGVIEQFQSTCRFIFTCNAVSTIHEAIQSRCQSFSFNYTDAKTKEEMIPKIIKRIELILKLEKVEFDSEVVIKLVSKYFPDIRKVINIIQQYSKEKNVIDSGVLTFETISDELINYVIQKKFTKAREFIITSNYSMSEIYSLLYKFLVPKIEKDKQAQIIIILAEYQYKSAFATDRELNLSACLLQIIGEL